ncbi:oxidative damage protection protein [Ostreibacterium oceani]|uniref:oxidative damage protection protein n=1 Tax=Ostreibacterium oceani TaxID=2654998 RepID=UPI0038B3ECAB
MVYCVKLKKEGEGLSRPPIPGELGKRIQENISQEAWTMWLGQQTILINEYRLNPIDPQARQFLEEQMQTYLFED